MNSKTSAAREPTPAAVLAECKTEPNNLTQPLPPASRWSGLA